MKKESKKKFDALTTKANLERVDLISEFSRINKIKQQREVSKELLLTEILNVEAELTNLDNNKKNQAMFSGEGGNLKNFQVRREELKSKRLVLEEKLVVLDLEIEKTEKRLEIARQELVLTQSKMSKISKISENNEIGEMETDSYIEESNLQEQSASRSMTSKK